MVIKVILLRRMPVEMVQQQIDGLLGRETLYQVYYNA